jgi:hypothetical protein
MLPDKIRLIEIISHVDVLLHTGQFLELERLSEGVRLTAAQMKIAIEAYPEELGPRPAYDLEEGSVVHVSGSAPAEWSVYLHLWLKQGGRSDLTAELTLIDTDSGLYRVQIDNIHVL